MVHEMSGISERVAERVRVLPVRRSALDAAREGPAERQRLGRDEVAALDALLEELQADTDILLDDRYARMLERLEARFTRRRLAETVLRPDRVVDRGYPLYAPEVAQLFEALEVPIASVTLDRWVERGLIPTPPRIGTGDQLSRNAYFARHVVDALYLKVVLGEPEAVAGELRVLTGALPEEHAVYFERLPGVQRPLLARATQAHR